MTKFKHAVIHKRNIIFLHWISCVIYGLSIAMILIGFAGNDLFYSRLSLILMWLSGSIFGFTLYFLIEIPNSPILSIKDGWHFIEDVTFTRPIELIDIFGVARLIIKAEPSKLKELLIQRKINPVVYDVGILSINIFSFGLGIFFILLPCVSLWQDGLFGLNGFRINHYPIFLKELVQLFFSLAQVVGLWVGLIVVAFQTKFFFWRFK